ncbi:unnamed protein product [Rotaria sordida]|uniref:UBC core domain-containing protein n=1 Tax=Rotaria sordida TaxID=392033 RepID=A0A814QG53_9BILA|nr:unnamed protein product [Rotaria sordida]
MITMIKFVSYLFLDKLFSVSLLNFFSPFKSSSMAVRRLQQDFRHLLNNKVEGIDASPSSDNFFVWNAIICGPEQSIYESGAFQLQFIFPDDYPLRPPQVRFITKVFHPNVWWEDGLICVDILKDGWTPSYDVLSILHSIRLLLSDPNPLSPANLEAALLYRDCRTEFNRRVLQMIQDSLDTDDEDENDDDDDDDDDNSDEDDNGNDNDNEDTPQIEDGDTLRQKTTILRHSITE